MKKNHFDTAVNLMKDCFNILNDPDAQFQVRRWHGYEALHKMMQDEKDYFKEINFGGD